MQYYSCPRCTFKIAVNTRFCRTCGYELPRVTTSAAAEEQQAAKKQSVWARVLGLGNEERKPSEPAQEKPAMG